MNTANTRIINDNFLVSSVKSYFEALLQAQVWSTLQQTPGRFSGAWLQAQISELVSLSCPDNTKKLTLLHTCPEAGVYLPDMVYPGGSG